MKRDKRTDGAGPEARPESTQTCHLRLPRSLMEAVARISREDGTSINRFVATAVAEKLSAVRTATYFTDRKARADFKAFDKIMKRKGGKPPRKGDEMASKVVGRIAPKESRRLAQVRAAVRGLRKLQKEIAQRNPEPITDKEIRDAINEGRP